jgi:hypothetical protein
MIFNFAYINSPFLSSGSPYISLNSYGNKPNGAPPFSSSYAFNDGINANESNQYVFNDGLTPETSNEYVFNDNRLPGN